MRDRLAASGPLSKPQDGFLHKFSKAMGLKISVSKLLSALELSKPMLVKPLYALMHIVRYFLKGSLGMESFMRH